MVPDIIPYSHDSSRVKCQHTPSISRYCFTLQHCTRRLRKLQKGARVCRTQALWTERWGVWCL